MVTFINPYLGHSALIVLLKLPNVLWIGRQFGRLYKFTNEAQWIQSLKWFLFHYAHPNMRKYS